MGRYSLCSRSVYIYRPSLPVVSLKLLTWSALDPNTEARWRMNVDAGTKKNKTQKHQRKKKHCVFGSQKKESQLLPFFSLYVNPHLWSRYSRKSYSPNKIFLSILESWPSICYFPYLLNFVFFFFLNFKHSEFYRRDLVITI